MLSRGETEDTRALSRPLARSETHALGIPDTSLSGRSTRTALSVRRSNSVPTVAKMLEERNRNGKQRVGFRVRQVGRVLGAWCFHLLAGRPQAGDMTLLGLSSVTCNTVLMSPASRDTKGLITTPSRWMADENKGGTGRMAAPPGHGVREVFSVFHSHSQNGLWGVAGLSGLGALYQRAGKHSVQQPGLRGFTSQFCHCQAR